VKSSSRPLNSKLAMPKLDDRTREDLALYTTDDLRRLYQTETGELIRLRDSNLTRAELKAEILRRVCRERWVARLTLLAAVIGAVAAIVAAIEGWH
jgi:hypothetical protein